MASWTVHRPANAYGADALERAAFVRDGFSWAAFLVPALWLLWNRLWLGLLAFVIATAALAWGGAAIGLDTLPATAIAFLISLYVGLEGGALRRWKLDRKGFEPVGVVGATSREEAERRAVALLLEAAPQAAPPPAASATSGGAPSSGARHGATDVLGSFPEPGGL